MLPPVTPRLLLLMLLAAALPLSCGSFLQGPLYGRITMERPADAVDAVVFLRCRGPDFIHGEMNTDAEKTRVSADGKFAFVGSVTLPNTTHCSIQIRHPRYLTPHIPLEKTLVHKLGTIELQSWDAFFAAGSPYELNPGTHRQWPETEVRRHLRDTVTWLRTFNTRDQHRMARYVPEIHGIYARARQQLPRPGDGWSDMLKTIATIEDITAYPYPFTGYREAVLSNDAETVQTLLTGGVLRATQYQGQQSMLYLAASKGNLEVIAVLLANDEPLNLTGCAAPLQGAILQKQWLAAQTLIRTGAEVKYACPESQPNMGYVLSNFARSGQLDLLRDFLDAGTPVDTRNHQGRTALAEAVNGGHIEAVKILLAAGANPDEKAAGNVSLIAMAQTKGYLDIERELQLASGRQVAPAPPPGQEFVSLPWRLAETQPYRIHTSFGQVSNMAADPQQAGVLWLATWGGLVRVEPTSGKRQTWTRADGMPGSPLKNLWFDQNGKFLWLAANGGLARMPVDQAGRIETIGGTDLARSYAKLFLPASEPDAVWFVGHDGLYHLEVKNSRALRYALPQTPFGAAHVPGDKEFYISDNSALWRFNTATGDRKQVLSGQTLEAYAIKKQREPPQLRSLSVDAAQGYLWMGSHSHGVFRLDIDSGDITRPVLTPEQLAQCASDTTTGRMYGWVKHAAGQTFAQLGYCFGRIDEANRYQVLLRQRIDGGPVADAKGDIWFVTDDHFYRLDSGGEQVRFPRAADPLMNSQARALEHVGDQVLVSFQRGPKSVLDLKNRTWSTLDEPPKKIVPGSKRHETVDPDVPEFTWQVQNHALFLRNNGRMIHQWPAKLRRGEIRVTRDKTTTVWIASDEGLIEFPISESLGELRTMAEPKVETKQKTKTTGRGAR